MMFGGSSDVTVGVADADGEAPVNRAENRRRWFSIAGATVGIVGFSAFLTTLYTGFRHVEAGGGFCASGGPYQIAHQCTAGDTRQVFIGVIGMLIFGGVFVGLTGFADGPILVPSGLLWAALFGSLGAGFIVAPKGTSSGSNYGVGILFLLMAAGGLWPAITSGVGWLRRGGAPEPDDPAFGGQVPLVRAAVEAPVTNAPPAPASTGPNKPVVPARLVIPPKDGP
jgi:hypothetical protein